MGTNLTNCPQVSIESGKNERKRNTDWTKKLIEEHEFKNVNNIDTSVHMHG